MSDNTKGAPAPKILIVGLPRTGTTSVCANLLNAGFCVAHTAFTEAAFRAADVLADAPIFADYAELDQHIPGSRFVYLKRSKEAWGQSIFLLLERMRARAKQNPHAFHPLLMNAYHAVFPDWINQNHSISFYQECYDVHQSMVRKYFKRRQSQLLEIDVADPQSHLMLSQFLSIEPLLPFERLNQNGKISDWQRIKNAGKVDPNLSGINGRSYFSWKNIRLQN